MAQFIYQKHCSEIIAAITQGTLTHGDKLDSVRTLAQKRKIGVSTAIHVYQALERQGWIIAVAKKGYFVHQPPKSQAQSYGSTFVSSRDLSQLPLATAVQYSLSMPDVLPLSCTAPSTVLDAESLLNKMHRKALRARPYRLQNHDPIETAKPLRKAIAKYLLSSGQQVHHDDILITNGRNDGLSIALRASKLLQSRVAIEAPCSMYFQSILQQYNIPTVAVPMQSDFAQELLLLEKAWQIEPFSAYLFNPNFNDPTGRVLTDDEKIRLIHWAQSRAVTLIEYDRGELYFASQRPASTASLLPDDNDCKIISISDFYDTVSDRFGLGYLICKNTYQACEASKQIASEEQLVSSQAMMLELFQSGLYTKHVNKLRLALAQQCKTMQNILKDVLKLELAQGQIYISRPAGGPCLWIGLPKEKPSQDLWQLLIKKQVAIAPGCLFLKNHYFDNYLRVTFGLVWDEKMEQGVIQLAQTIKSFVCD
jgi:DNA-binding transcriptional MocR family regulator